MEELAIVIPAYNEELTIAGTLSDFHAAAPHAFFVIVDNNSSDQTSAIANDTLQGLGARGTVLREIRQGKGYAMRRGFKEVNAKTYVMTDADRTYPAAALDGMLQLLDDTGADMVVGDRRSEGHYQNENKRQLHNFGNALVTWLVNRLFRAKLVDIMSGYRVLSRRFVKNYPILVDGFELETDMTLHALDKRMLIVETPVDYRDRPAGSESKLDTIADGARVLFVIFQLLRYYRPMLFFGFLSILFFVLGLMAGILPVLDYMRYGYVYRLPLAVLATGLQIFSLLSLATALILDSITHSNKMQLEKDF